MTDRATWCADNRHPGATYNPWHDCTWCVCGHACYPGNHAQHITCCDGPLARQRRAPVDRATAVAARLAAVPRQGVLDFGGAA